MIIRFNRYIGDFYKVWVESVFFIVVDCYRNDSVVCGRNYRKVGGNDV